MARETKILVTGATGTVGGQVVRQLADAGADARALARDPATADLPGGVEVVRGDLADPESLEQPLDGVDAVFLVWPFLTSQGAPAVLDAVKRHARRVVYLSTAGARPGAASPANPILRFHSELEAAIERSGVDWVMLRPGSFASNRLGWAAQARGGVVREAYGAQARALIHEADIAVVAVQALTRDDLLGTRPVLSGPEVLTTEEQAAVLGEAIGTPLRFEELSAEAARAQALAAGYPEDLVAALFDGAEDVPAQEITTAVEDIAGRPPRSFRDWVLDHADAFR